MMKLNALADFVGGTPQFRFKESSNLLSPVYSIYSQIDLHHDLDGIRLSNTDHKIIHTFDKENILCTGDIYIHKTMLINSKEGIDSEFLAYCLNENERIQQQFQIGLQGFIVMKYPLKTTERSCLSNNTIII